LETLVAFTSHALAPGNLVLASMLMRPQPGATRRVLMLLEDNLVALRRHSPSQAAAWMSAHARRFTALAPPVIVEGGETAAQDSHALAALQARFTLLRMTARDAVVAVGGSSFLALVRTAAATCHGGIPVIALPTTSTAQITACRAAWLGRNGVQRALGTMAPPAGILVDAELPETSSSAEHRAGRAAALEAGMFGDPQMVRWLRDHANALNTEVPGVTALMVRQALQLNLNTSFSDDHSGTPPLSSVLAEGLMEIAGNRLHHGEALGLTLVWSAVTSWMAGVCDQDAMEQVLHAAQELGLRVWDLLMGDAAGCAAVAALIDGEVLGMDGAGRAVPLGAVDARVLLHAGQWLRCYGASGSGTLRPDLAA